jgi:hypothetical protein
MWRHDQVLSSGVAQGIIAGCGTSGERKEDQMKENYFEDKGCGKLGDIAISRLDDVLMLGISCVALREEAIQGQEAGSC